MGNTSRFRFIDTHHLHHHLGVMFSQKIWSHNIAKGAVKTHGFDLPRVLGASYYSKVLLGMIPMGHSKPCVA